MTALICPDKFKHTFSARQVSELIERALQKTGIKTVSKTLSDGGEGFLEAIESNLDVKRIVSKTFDPLMRPLETYFLFDADNRTAYIELAKTGSLSLLAPQERNPMHTTTYGFGIQIKQAIEAGAKHIVTGLGGSSTTDAGTGMAAALGWRFFDNDGNELEPTGENLVNIRRIIPPQRSYDVSVTACSDVNNPLYGPEGAAFVYSPQKGASPEEVKLLDSGLKNFADVIYKELGKSVANIPGAGAAGGLGAGLVAFLNARLVMGASFVADLTGLDEFIHSSDIVITGEGKVDRQSFYGKVIAEVIRRAGKYGKRVVIIAGRCEQVSLPANVELRCLFDRDMPIDKLIALTPERIKQAVSSLFDG